MNSIRTGRAALAVAAIAAGVLSASCARTVDGSAERAVPAAAEHGFGYADDRCAMLEDSTVQNLLDAQAVVRPYSGAVCHYVLQRAGGTVDAIFSWFEHGSLDRERAVAAERGAQLSDEMIERHPTLLARSSGGGAACSATTAAGVEHPTGSGVLSWWVQFRGQDAVDPCAAATRLLAATLSSAM